MNDSTMKDLPVLTERAEKLKVVVWILSVVVLVLVALMRTPYKFTVSQEIEEWIKQLPGVIALINTLVAACLLGGLLAIFKKKPKVHQYCMTTALVLSTIFLLCYVSYHFTTHETIFGDADGNRVLDEAEKEKFGNLRKLYLGVLLSHIAAAAISFPMILMTFVHAWTRNFEKHRKLARKTFPLWFYVSVTGPFCYWMLKAFYQ